jgi:hypothetical protein
MTTDQPLHILTLTSDELDLLVQGLLAAIFSFEDFGLNEDREQLDRILAIIERCKKDDGLRLG